MSDDIEPYPEPDAQSNDYPDEWTPKQCENWKNYGHFEYEALETDVGRYWYRRTWRPKMRGEAMMLRDHVKLGTPEDYVAENVSDRLNPMGDLTSVMMREFSRFSADKDELKEAVDDIVQTKLRQMEPAQRDRVSADAKQLARAYGLEVKS